MNNCTINELGQNVAQIPYIGRQINHFEMVDLEGIEAEFSDNMVYRYTLSLPYKSLPLIDEPKRIKNACIILKNPSSADIKRADKTIQTAAKTIYSAFADVKCLDILNIFALRGTKPTDVNEFHNRNIDVVGPKNNEAFMAKIAECDYVIIAWGGAAPINKPLYDGRISEVFEIIKNANPNAKIYRKAEKGDDKYPFHACYWPINNEFVEITK